MSLPTTSKKHSKSIARNVVFAFLLAAAAIFMSWSLTKGIFLRMLQTVHSLAEPSPKLQFVNNVFREVVMLDQLQRSQAVSVGNDRKPYNLFLKESQHLQHMLDTLRMYSSDNPGQLPRIDSMKTLLRERDRLLLNYLKLRSDVIRNDTLSVQIRKLSDLLASDSNRTDNSVVTTEQKITTIIEPVDSVITPDNAKQSFWSRLTGRKKEPEVVRMQRLIQEDLKIHIDTLASAREDSLVQEISAGIATIEADMQQKREGLIRQQMQLTRSGNMLVSQVLIMLQDIETEELDHVNQNNLRATELVNTGIGRLKLIVTLFITGAGILLFVIFIDISKSNRYRTELISAKEEAEQLGKVKERFLANMSHELRTPLQTIIGISEQMQRNGAHQPSDVDTLYRSSQHLLQSVNEVLDYNRITAGKIVLEEQPFDVGQAVEEVRTSMQILADKKGLSFIFTSDLENDVLHRGDAFRLKQILYNLLGNAIKFTEKGSVTFRLTHRDLPRSTSFIFSVKDTGIGIAPEDRGKIFRQFERVAPESLQGTGLGLSIVKELTDAFKGTISINSEPGTGSEFTIVLSLPRVKKMTTQETDEADTETGQFLENVWVVDDDAFILKLCSDILEKYKIPHRCFHDAASLLSQSGSEPVHTVLMDIRMPGTDGYALLEALKNDPFHARTRMIALTAQAMPDEKDKIRHQGFDGLLMKPFLEKELLDLFHVRQKAAADISAPRHTAFATIITMTGGDRDLIRTTLQNYITETRQDMDRLALAVTQENPEDTSDLLHRLAGRTGQMGAGDIASELRHTEIRIRESGIMQPLPAHTVRQISELLEEAAQYLDTLG